MKLKVTWLPNGHVVHGYRRVFLLHDEVGNAAGVVVFAPMGYEAAYGVFESAKGRPDFAGVEVDSTLLWGLSLLSGVYWRQLHAEDADDGYMKLRAVTLEPSQLISGHDYVQAVSQGYFKMWTETNPDGL